MVRQHQQLNGHELEQTPEDLELEPNSLDNN